MRKGTTTPSAIVGQDSLLSLVNQNPYAPICACIALLNSHEQLSAVGLVPLSGLDNDTINLCTMLDGSPVPGGGVYLQATTGRFPTAAATASGIVQVTTFLSIDLVNPCDSFAMLAGPIGGAYGSIRDVVYRGKKKASADPYSAPVLATGRTELRVTASDITSSGLVFDFCLDAAGTALVAKVPASAYVDGTFE